MERIEGFHVAAIMDGNGRWAQKRLLPRTAGHKAGVKVVRDIVPHCPKLNIRVLTLYAFSSDNWKRPKSEVKALMKLMADYLRRETATCVEKGIRINIIGRRDRLDPDLVRMIETAESATAHISENVLRLAVDYSAKHALLTAAQNADEDEDQETFNRRIQKVHNASIEVPPIDLLIRTGGEQRLSDFQLWEAAYAELLFLPCFWPDFTKKDLGAAVETFNSRQRRFGMVPGAGETSA